MVTIKEVETWALAFPETVEMPHFEKTSFRVAKKIFATVDKKNQKVVVKLNAVDQSVFSTGNTGIRPLQNAWGKQGWTIIELKKVRKTLFKDALQTAFNEVAPQRLKIIR
ncbi:MAG TPA: MmcQ/YjbR family DNA-binding protein [Cyclobacteriaceae bacterium]|nr:MmcQ/YjbR family DNA-binding protein [Cyclobacteriaceae bacterium]